MRTLRKLMVVTITAMAFMATPVYGGTSVTPAKISDGKMIHAEVKTEDTRVIHTEDGRCYTWKDVESGKISKEYWDTFWYNSQENKYWK